MGTTITIACDTKLNEPEIHLGKGHSWTECADCKARIVYDVAGVARMRLANDADHVEFVCMACAAPHLLKDVEQAREQFLKAFEGTEIGAILATVPAAALEAVIKKARRH